MVQFGVSLSNRAVALGWVSGPELVDLACRAEESGQISSVWVGDSIVAKPRLEATVTLSAIASVTSTVELGTACMATFPFRNPVLFAHQWASLDSISGGRALLAVCLGGHGPRELVAREFETFGATTKERVPRMLENMDILRRLWTEDDVTHEGRFVGFRNVTIGPKPIQQPCPIWIANNPSNPDIMERAFRRVARHADGWMTGSLTPEEFEKRWQYLKALRVDEGKAIEGFRSSLHVRSHVADDREAAFDAAKAFLDVYYSVDHKRAHLEEECAIGTTEECIDRYVSYARAGCDVIIIRLLGNDLQDQLRRWTEDVIPEVRARLRKLDDTGGRE